MPDMLETFAVALVSPNLGAAEFIVAVLVACGLVTIALTSILPGNRAENLEWWERKRGFSSETGR